MRQDRYIDNDSGAYSILPSWVVSKVIEDERENDARFVKKHQAILQSLVGDDAFIARVVVDEPLTEAEREEWISVVRWPLRVKCGKLLISGGFDPDWIADLLEEPTPFISVPPGDYVVEVYTYLNTMSGRVHRGDWGADMQLGTWFRREHPGRAFPTWVASELFWAPEEDPGHEDEWNNIASSVRAGTLKIEPGPMSWVGVVVHLTRDTSLELSTPDEDGFFPADAGLRRPTRFPLGIPSDDEEPTVSSEVRDAISPNA